MVTESNFHFTINMYLQIEANYELNYWICSYLEIPIYFSISIWNKSTEIKDLLINTLLELMKTTMIYKHYITQLLITYQIENNRLLAR